MQPPHQIAEKFSSIDAHDDTVEGFSFIPATKRGKKAKLEVTLFRHWEGKRRLLTFTNCANIQLVLDADVLLDNAPNNTCALQATADSNEVTALMRKHKSAWNVSYQKRVDPLNGKLDVADKCVLFRVRVFGGVLQIIARSFSVRPISSPSALVTANGKISLP
ncbi:hypothetical protein [Uliginosibacterium gangwonense]|uniref:hypothetical protein n=1 Tax=Uliginosibacterium gangwonense TaxID=392736 RepID=UPI00035CCA37|nr:hypothetical protein [Uliginosibacterium gangwonense]